MYIELFMTENAIKNQISVYLIPLIGKLDLVTIEEIFMSHVSCLSLL